MSLHQKPGRATNLQAMSEETDTDDAPDISMEEIRMEAPAQQPPGQLLPGGGSDDNEAAEQSVQGNYRPSSLGLSVLAQPVTKAHQGALSAENFLRF